MREDLIQLIEHAGANGQVTGLATNGHRLADQAYLDRLLQTGLDHLLLVLPGEKDIDWTAVQNAVLADIFTTVHLTLTEHNSELVSDQIKRLAQMGLNSISLSAASPELGEQLLAARELTASQGLPLVWDLPVPYAVISPIYIDMEGSDHSNGAGRAWLYVEPNGDVRPAQGRDPVLGNLLRDSWEKIWPPSHQE